MTMNNNKSTNIINNSTQICCEECSPNNNTNNSNNNTNNNSCCWVLLRICCALVTAVVYIGVAPVLAFFYILLVFFFTIWSWGIVVILSPFVFGNDLIETEQNYRALGITAQAYLVEKKIVKDNEGHSHVEHTFQYTSPENGCTYQKTLTTKGEIDSFTITVLFLPGSPEMAKRDEDFLLESQFYFWLAPFLFWIKFNYYYHYKRSSSSPSYAVMLTTVLSGCWWYFFISDFKNALEDPLNSLILLGPNILFGGVYSEEMSPMAISLLCFGLTAFRVICLFVNLHFVRSWYAPNERWQKVCPLHGVKEPLPLEEDQELVLLEKERELVQLD